MELRQAQGTLPNEGTLPTHGRRGPPKFTAKQLASNRKRAAKALADWNAGTGQYSEFGEQGSGSHSIHGTGGDSTIPSPIPAGTSSENAKTNEGTAAGPAVGTPPLVPNTASPEEEEADSANNTPSIPYKRFHGFDRVRVTDTFVDCVQDGDAVERHHAFGPNSQYIAPLGFGAHVPGHGTPQMSADDTDLDSTSDGDPNDTQARRQEDEDLHPPTGPGFFHKSGRIGFGLLDPNTQCPSLATDEGLTQFPGMDASSFENSQMGIQSTPAIAIGGTSMASCRNSRINGKAARATGLTATSSPLNRGTSMERGAPRTRSTPPRRGATQSTIAGGTDATMRTTNAEVRDVVTNTPMSGPTRPLHTTRTTPPSSRALHNRMAYTPTGALGVAAPPTNSTATTVTRMSPFSTTPAFRTSSTPWSCRPFATTIRRTPNSTSTTQGSTPPLDCIPTRTVTCTPPSTETIRNVQVTTPLTPLCPNTSRATAQKKTSALCRGVLRTASTSSKEIPRAQVLSGRNNCRRPNPRTSPYPPVSSRVPPTPPSSPVMSRMPPSRATFTSPPAVTAPQVRTSETNRNNPTEGGQSNGTCSRPQVRTSESDRGTSTLGAQNNGLCSRPRRSQRNVAGTIPTQGSDVPGLDDNVSADDNTPPMTSCPVNQKRFRKDMDAKELMEVREREKMRKRQQRAHSRLLSSAPVGGNAASGSISMRWRPMIKLFDGIPVGDSQQQLVRALSRFLPSIIPCYRHARSITDAELARIHTELQTRYENGSALLPTWTRRACRSLLLSRRMRVRTRVRAHLLNLANRPEGAIEPPAGVLQCELNFFVRELASDEFQRKSAQMAAISRAMVAARGCGNAMGAGGVDRARALHTLQEGKPPTIEEVRAWKDKCVKAYKKGHSRTAVELRLQDPGPIDSDDDIPIDDNEEVATWDEDEQGSDSGSDSHPARAGYEAPPCEVGDGTSDPDWHHPFLGPAAFYRRYVFLYGKDPTSEELEAWLSSGRPPLPPGN